MRYPLFVLMFVTLFFCAPELLAAQCGHGPDRPCTRTCVRNGASPSKIKSEGKSKLNLGKKKSNSSQSGKRHRGGSGFGAGNHETVSLFANWGIIEHNQSLLNYDDNYELTGSTNISLNLRFLNHNDWAFRIGVGMSDIDYKLSGPGASSISINNGTRKDYIIFLGLEKHIHFLPSLDIYPGIFIPFNIVGNDILNDGFTVYPNDGVDTGIGALLGANVSFMRFLRFGVEGSVTYKTFKQQVSAALDPDGELGLKDMQYRLDMVLGVAF